MQFDFLAEEGTLICTFQSRVIPLPAVRNCLLWYLPKYIAKVEVLDDEFIQLSLKKKEGTIDLEYLKAKLNQDLLDFSLRNQVDTETRVIRELIAAKAFSHGEFDETPPGSFDDPVDLAEDD